MTKLIARAIGEPQPEPKERNSRIDNAITVINYIIKKKKRRNDDMAKRVDLTENQRVFLGEETDLIRNIEILMQLAKKSLGEHLGKLPPQAVDLEPAVLGAAIFENTAFEAVRSFLKPEHFYIPSHQLIWAAALEVGKNLTFHMENDRNNTPYKMYENGVDIHKIVLELRKRGHLELIGGGHYVAELTTRVSSSANTEYHARVLIEMAIKREMIMMASRVLHDGYDDGADCFEMIDFAENEIKNIKAWIN